MYPNRSRVLNILMLVLVTFFTIFLWHSIPDCRNSIETTTSNIHPVIHPEYKCCIPLNNTLLTNIYFIKTHKTGGTTVQNIILRFALRFSLDVMNTIYLSYYLPFSDQSIYPHVRTPNNKYNILAHHMRYSLKMKEYQYPNTSMVTIMRHPAKLFPSLYNYFHMSEATGMTFQQFMNAPIKPPFVLSTTSFVAYRGYNQMSYDLGFDLERNANNQTAIDQFVEKIDQEFDLVMIMEHMEASLVLLANLMGWPLEYVAHLKMNARPVKSNSYTLSAKDELTLMELNHVDTLLYHHFLKKFQKCVTQYGEEKMQRKITQLKVLNQNLKERCVAKESIGGLYVGYFESIDYEPKNTSDSECVYATSSEILLENIVIDEQFKRLHSEDD